MTLAELRRAAEALPEGAGLTLDRTTLLEVLENITTSTTYTVVMVAEHLHRKPSTVRDWLKDNRFPGAYRLPGAKRPGAWRIPQAALDTFAGVKPSLQDAPQRTIAPRTAPRVHSRRAQTPPDLSAWRRERPEGNAA